MKFKAFISYSHALDHPLASSIHHALHRLGKPWYKPHALRIFRDETDLSASPNLWQKILDGLGASEFLILMASRKAAASKWVKQEVAHWSQTNSIQNVIIVLTDGDLVWSDQATDFDWEKTNALPEAFRGMFKAEPLWVDFRDMKGDLDLSLSNPAFKQKIVSIAATLHGKSPAEMVGEEIAQHRKTLRIRNTAIALLSFLTLLSISAAFVALRQRGIANDRLRVAQSNEFSSRAALEISKDPTYALMLADSALMLLDSNQKAQDVIFQVVRRAEEFPLYHPLAVFPEIADGKLSQDGKRFYVARGKTLAILDECGESVHEVEFPEMILRIDVAPNDSTIALLGHTDQVYLLDVTTKVFRDLHKDSFAFPSDGIAFSPLGNFVLATTEAWGAQIFDLQASKWLAPTENALRNSQMDYASFCVFSPDDRYIAMSFAEEVFHVLDLVQDTLMTIEPYMLVTDLSDTTASILGPSSCAFEASLLRVKAGDFLVQMDLKTGHSFAKPIFSRHNQLPFDGQVDFALDQSALPGHLLTNGFRIRFDENLQVQEVVGTGMQSASEIRPSSMAGVLLAKGNEGGIQWTNSRNWRVDKHFLVDATDMLDFGLHPTLGLRAILGDGRIVQWRLDPWMGSYLLAEDGEHMEFQPQFSDESDEVYLFMDDNRAMVFDMEGKFLRLDSVSEPDFDPPIGPFRWWKSLYADDLVEFENFRELESFRANFKVMNSSVPGDVAEFPNYLLSPDHRHVLLYWNDPYRPIAKAYLFPTQASQVAKSMKKRLAKRCEVGLTD